jgi:hypothetical protein
MLLAAFKYFGDRWIEHSAALFNSSPYVKTAWRTALIMLLLSATVALNAPAPHIVYRGF